MKVVLTLLARDEADVVGANLAFHLSAGVDAVVATDNRSSDGTTDILEAYAREGLVHVLREDSDAFDQSGWVTRMARIAATELGADWVVNADADEFWWPRGASLKEVLAAMPDRYGILRAPIRHFFLRADADDRFFAEQMTVRPRLSAPVNEPENPLRPNTHVLHRADATAVVGAGNHALQGSAHALLPGWHPIEVLHFPLRGRDQARRKYENWVHVRAGREYRDAFDASGRGELDELVESKLLANDVLERGLAEGSLVEDTRLRDALRALAGEAPVSESRAFDAPMEGAGEVALPRPSAEDDAVYAAEVAVLAEADAVRLQRRLDELEARLVALEGGIGARARRAISHVRP